MVIKNRNIALCIVFSIITCGIYGLYWFICLNDDVNTLSGHTQDGTSGGIALLLSIVTCNIYFIYWNYKQGEKIDEAKNARGISSSNTGVLYLLLSIFGLGIISYALMQSELNNYATA